MFSLSFLLLQVLLHQQLFNKMATITLDDNWKEQNVIWLAGTEHIIRFTNMGDTKQLEIISCHTSNNTKSLWWNSTQKIDRNWDKLWKPSDNDEMPIDNTTKMTKNVCITTNIDSNCCVPTWILLPASQVAEFTAARYFNAGFILKHCILKLLE